jgi:hypothetical protein
LYNLADCILEVEDEWRVPVFEIVDVAMIAGSDDEVIVTHGHVDDASISINYVPLLEIELLVHLIKQIYYVNFVVLSQRDLPLVICQASFDDMAEHNGAISSSSSTDGPVRGPRDAHQRALIGLVVRVSPPRFIAELQHVVCAYSEVIAIGRPLDTRDHVIVRCTCKQQSAVLVEDLVLAILTA